MPKFQSGDIVYIKGVDLEKNGVNLNGQDEYCVDGYFQAEIISLVTGRTWDVRVCGDIQARIASRYFKNLPVQGLTRVARHSSGFVGNLGGITDVSDEDCDVESVEGDAMERHVASAPSKRNSEIDWVECSIPQDAREVAGV